MNLLKNYILWPLLALLLAMVTYLSLTFITHQALDLMKSKEELLWQFMVNDFSNNDPDKQLYIQKFVDQLPYELIPKQYSKITILVTQDNHINAFAAPGGRIILTTGLLKALKSENALLFVISHEITHLSRKDHLYEFARMLVSKTYGIITLSKLVPELLMLIDNPRIHQVEFLADKQAIKSMLLYYGHAGGADEFFQILLKENSNLKSFSHPETIKRLENIYNFISHNKIDCRETKKLSPILSY